MDTDLTSKYQHYAVWLSVGIMYPFSLLLFPMAFFFCFYPIRNLCKSSVCTAVQKHLLFCCGKQKIKNSDTVHFHVQPAYSTQGAPSYPESSRVSPPSTTWFQVPYTNDFTHVTTENASLKSDANGDTGYGSVSQY